MARLFRPLSLSVLATLTLALSVHADTTTAPAFNPPPLISNAEISGFLKPYINDDTFMVMHLDVAQIDTAALEKFAVDTITAAAPGQADMAQKVSAARLIADAFLGRFKQLGGRHIYFLMQQDGDHPPHPPILLFPLEQGGDAKTLTTLLTSIPNSASAQISDTLVALEFVPPFHNPDPNDPSNAALADKLKAIVPSARPDLEQALSAGTGALQLALSPGAPSRKIFAEKNPLLPPELGGGSSDIVFKNFQYLLVTLSPPPALKIVYTIQSDSPENAKTSADLIKTWSKMMNQQMSRMNSPTPIDFMAIFTPVVEGSTVTIALDGEKLQSVTAMGFSAFNAGRRQAVSISSMSSIKQDVLGLLMYANDNNGNFPPDLHTLLDKGYIQSDKSLTNPADAKHRAYEYHPWTADEQKKLDPSTTPVVWEATDSDTVALNVGFLDGHVERVKDKAAFDKVMDAAKDKLKTP